jgi:hypothetical protein
MTNFILPVLQEERISSVNFQREIACFYFNEVDNSINIELFLRGSNNV